MRVQGAEAPAEIAGAIRYANKYKVADVIITGRGGGSMEDLWAFNEEVVARAIVRCPVPVISAVGHEPDVTIADFVADVRAATPSNGAELIAPDQSELRILLHGYAARMAEALTRQVKLARQRLDAAARSRALTGPAAYVQERRLYLPAAAAGFTPHGTALLCTALTSGSLEERLAAAAEKWGPERLALDLQRMMLDYPLSAGGEAAALTPPRLHALAEGRATYFSRPLCARYFTYRTDGGSRFVLFDDVQTLRMKMEMAEKLGIRQGFFMLPEVEDLAQSLLGP